MEESNSSSKTTVVESKQSDAVPTGCVGPQSELAGKATACQGCPNAASCASGKFRAPDPAIAQVAKNLNKVEHTIIVFSGKGGVGKSTVASQLAWYLSHVDNMEVGLLDIDITGPSIPRMMGVEGQSLHPSGSGWGPVFAAHNLSVVSVACMLDSSDSAVIWRGPRKTTLIKQFLTDIAWGHLNFLVIDSPPGTSDEHISVAQYMSECHVDGALIVTTPQEISLLAVRKEITFCRKVHVPILGVLENMSGFVCPCCHTRTEIFKSCVDGGGGAKMAAEMGVPFLGSVPLDPQLLQCCDAGEDYLEKYPTLPGAVGFSTVFDKLIASSPSMAATYAKVKSETADHDHTDHGHAEDAH